MKRTSVLIAGHDLKFLTHVIDHYKAKQDHQVEVYTYSNHALPGTDKLLLELAGYDIIFCEWGLGNLKWFSQNKFPDQKLITRIHLQEFSTSFLSETNWDNVDKVIVVGPFMKERFDRLFPEYHEKCVVIPNLIDTISFNLEKEEGSIFNLGLLGILPKRKAPHLGLEILKELRKTDERYKLHIKSKRPEEVDWLWKRPEEQEYYKEFFSNINNMGLQDAVILEPHGSDVQEWFRHIGFILSPSEFESFHMAIAEGMAAGSIPVIRNWEGASALFPENLIFKDVPDAVGLILNYQDNMKFQAETQKLKNYCSDHFSLNVLLPQYDKIMIREVNRKSMREEIKTLIRREQLLIIQNRQLLQENLQLKTELASLHQNNSRLMNDVASLHQNNSRLMNDVASLHQNNSRLMNDVASLHQNNSSLTNEIKQLKNEKNIAHEAIKKMKYDLNNLNKELKETNRKLSDIQNSLSWKVGSALIARPAGFIQKMIKK